MLLNTLGLCCTLLTVINVILEQLLSVASDCRQGAGNKASILNI